jgi:hypothetical protein
MIKSFSTILLASSLFMGCSSKSAMNVFSSDKLYEKGLEYTQVEDIINSFETKAIINATYLNSTDDKWDNKYQNFLVGIYIVNDNKEDKDKYLNNKKFTLTLNDKPIFKKTVLKSTNILYNHIPVKNPYAKYYIVEFQKDGNTTLKLSYKNTILNEKVTLSFQSE